MKLAGSLAILGGRGYMYLRECSLRAYMCHIVRPWLGLRGFKVFVACWAFIFLPQRIAV